MESPSNPHKRQKLGFESYSNSKILSDITIRYGVSGERTFEAHKVVLSAMSYWFKAAFTGQFAESSAREITLKEDDPDALFTMLNFAYDDKEVSPIAGVVDGVALSIRYYLSLYTVADKYDFPEFRSEIVIWFRWCIISWKQSFGRSIVKDDNALQTFCGFVKDVYDLAGPGDQSNHPLVKVLLELTDDQGSTACMLSNTGVNQPLVTMASRQVAEFGRDVFLHLMAKTGSSDAIEKTDVVTTGLCIGVKVECGHCRRFWWRVVRDGYHDNGTSCWCRVCKKVMNSWIEPDEESDEESDDDE